MALTPRLEMRPSQSLTLTPQLMQSIKLLQLSHLELNAFVETELERNPLLERDERDPEGGSESGDGSAERDDGGATETALGSAVDIAADMDTDVANVFPEQVGQDSVSQSLGAARDGVRLDGGQAPEIDNIGGEKISLWDHMSAHARLCLDDPADLLIASHLIDSLNAAGYLGVEPDQVAELLGTDLAHVERVLSVLQTVEPAGLCARSVPECLGLQLRERNRLDPMMQALLDHLDLAARHDFAALKRATGADREDIADMLAEIRSLDPRPGLGFDGAPVELAVPDVFIRPGRDGYQIELNSEVLPRVLVNRTYYAQVTGKARDATEKSFLSDCLQTANWLTKSLDQRAQTILKVSAEIVKQQRGFLDEGVAHLRPMTLRAVADEIGMHESTVSRVTANKYMATPRGLFEMKYFFTTALGSTSGGADHSAEAVRHRIRQLIDAESPADILSDDTIAAVLKKEQGIDIARRTVAKYREGMRIASSVQRRREKRALATA